MAKLRKELEFFSPDDRVSRGPQRGKTTSSFPRWYFVEKIRRLKEDIKELQVRIKSAAALNLLGVEAMQQELSIKTLQFNELVKGKPDIAKDKDRLWDFYKWATGVLRDTLLPTSQMKAMYKVTPREVYDRENKLAINIQAWRDVIGKCEQLDQCKNNMCSQKVLSICWKIVGSLLGEVTNVEMIRKDELTDVRIQERSLYEIEKEDGLRQP